MDAIESIKNRRSIRSFQSTPISTEVIEDIIDCARLAPTAINIQPWEFVVVRTEETRKKLSQITDYGKFISQSPVCIVVFCKDTKYYLEDGCAATQNILLAAYFHGICSCWVAGDKKTYAEEIRKLLNFPSGYKLISLIPIGYSQEKPEPPKRSLQEVIHWDKF